MERQGIYKDTSRPSLLIHRTAPHLEVVDQIRGHYLSPSIAHPPRGSELPHIGVHQRHPRRALLPPLHSLWIGPPTDRHVLRPALEEDSRAIFAAEEVEKVPPCEFEYEPIRAFVRYSSLLLISLDLCKDISENDIR